MSARRAHGTAPTEEQLVEYHERIEKLEVWWVTFDELVERIFCTDIQAATVWQADNSIAWAGIEIDHRPREVPCADPNVVCFEFEVPIELMAVDGNFMKSWMGIVRANGIHGKYRKAGTTKEYRF